ncbi:MAG TPA: helix-turn-helix domain-containing protein [Acidobacteriaceae bacterium]|jgi:DNA-binding HxlR family transcriptional regulator
MPATRTSRSIGASSLSAIPACPVERAIHVIGGKWKLLVLRSLLLNGPQGYNELLQTVTNISSKELTRNLKELAASGLVNRTAGASPRTTTYSLTKTGMQLMPTFKALLTWGQKSLSPNPAANLSVR